MAQTRAGVSVPGRESALEIHAGFWNARIELSPIAAVVVLMVVMVMMVVVVMMMMVVIVVMIGIGVIVDIGHRIHAVFGFGSPGLLDERHLLNGNLVCGRECVSEAGETVASQGDAADYGLEIHNSSGIGLSCSMT
jgi:hypothetical protein